MISQLPDSRVYDWPPDLQNPGEISPTLPGSFASEFCRAVWTFCRAVLTEIVLALLNASLNENIVNQN